MLGLTCEYKFGFHPNMSVQAIFKLLPIIVIQTKFGEPILLYS